MIRLELFKLPSTVAPTKFIARPALAKIEPLLLISPATVPPRLIALMLLVAELVEIFPRFAKLAIDEPLAKFNPVPLVDKIEPVALFVIPPTIAIADDRPVPFVD